MKTTTTIATIAVIAAVFTGCAAPDSAGQTNPSTTATETTGPFGSTDTGDVVNGITAAALLLGGKQLGYKMPNGLYVVVTKNEPLPETVQLDLNSHATQVSLRASRLTDFSESGLAYLTEMARGSRVTGKTVFYVWELSGSFVQFTGDKSVDVSNEGKPYWAVGGVTVELGSQFLSRAEADAFAASLVAGQEDPSAFAIVHAD